MRLTAIPRITIGLVSLAAGLLLVFELVLNIFPHDADTAAAGRAELANNLAIQTAALVRARDWRSVDHTLNALQSHDGRIASIGLRRNNGDLVAQAGGHAQRWAATAPRHQMAVGLLNEGQRWGALEIAFRAPSTQQAVTSWLTSGPTQLLMLFSVGASLLFFAYLRRMLQHLDPSAAVPERVRGAFDALVEGVMIIDPSEHILLVNRRLQSLAPDGPEADMVGRTASSLAWLRPHDASDADSPRPWTTAMHSRQPVRGQRFRVAGSAAEGTRVVVNCSPLLEDNGAVRGCLVTLDDVTALEQSHEQLLDVLADLAAAKDQLERKNVELEELASRDALSGSLNRRAFFQVLQRQFADARRQGGELVCILADIDKFKLINDHFGHAVGDEAIQVFARLLRQGAPRGAVVGRYGGEEFCVALPGATLERGLQIAEELRRRVAAEAGVGAASGRRVPMTASFGVATVRAGARNEAELVEQADQAMYLAKQSGRNRVVGHVMPAEHELVAQEPVS